MKFVKRILVLGHGAREGAIVRSLYRQHCRIYQESFKTKEELGEFVKERNIDMVIPGSENDIIKGITNYLDKMGVFCCAPFQESSKLESSKIFCRNICLAAGVKQPEYYISYTDRNLKYYVEETFKDDEFFVVKADGLAAGKGVSVVDSQDKAITEGKRLLETPAGHTGILVEKYLKGWEASLFYACNDDGVWFLGDAKDHKRRFEGGKGNNTGGMGALSPHPYMTDVMRRRVTDEIVLPTLKRLEKSTEKPYRGFLYAGVMIVDGDPYLIEFNVRLGDPEAQALLARYDRSFLSILRWMTGEKVNIPPPQEYVSCAITVCDESYAQDVKEKPCEIKEQPSNEEFRYIIPYENSGRKLSIVSLGLDFSGALLSAYSYIRRVDATNIDYRKDIGKEFTFNTGEVAVLVGSKSDMPVVQKCLDCLDFLRIPYSFSVVSAHRASSVLDKILDSINADDRYRVIIAAAGLSAALPGVCASKTTIPVIGLPIASGELRGVDALYSIAQMPPGVPVGCVGINNYKNAAYLAARIILNRGTDSKGFHILSSVLRDDQKLAERDVTWSK